MRSGSNLRQLPNKIIVSIVGAKIFDSPTVRVLAGKAEAKQFTLEIGIAPERGVLSLDCPLLICMLIWFQRLLGQMFAGRRCGGGSGHLPQWTCADSEPAKLLVCCQAMPAVPRNLAKNCLADEGSEV